MKERTLSLVQQALENLQEQGVKVTYGLLEKETRAIDPTGVGVNRTTFHRNEEVEALIAAVMRPNKPTKPDLDLDKIDLRNLRSGRDLRRTFREMMKKCQKADLALRVLALEEELISRREQMARQAYAEAEALEREFLQSGTAT